MAQSFGQLNRPARPFESQACIGPSFTDDFIISENELLKNEQNIIDSLNGTGLVKLPSLYNQVVEIAQHLNAQDDDWGDEEVNLDELSSEAVNQFQLTQKLSRNSLKEVIKYFEYLKEKLKSMRALLNSADEPVEALAEEVETSLQDYKDNLTKPLIFDQVWTFDAHPMLNAHYINLNERLIPRFRSPDEFMRLREEVLTKIQSLSEKNFEHEYYQSLTEMAKEMRFRLQLVTR
jgi:hypothetical protein